MGETHQPLDTLIENATKNGNWKLVLLPSSHVDLPARPIPLVEDIIDTLTDQKVETSEEYLLNQRLKRAGARRHTAFISTMSTTEGDQQARHTCTVELGDMHTNQPREWYVEYVFEKGDYTLSVSTTNRRYFEDRPEENMTSLHVIATNIPMRRRPFPFLDLDFQDGTLNTIFYRNRHERKLITKSSLFQFLYRPFPKILFAQDLQTQRLDMQQTMDNLLHNMNNATPVDPLHCFVFQKESNS